MRTAGIEGARPLEVRRWMRTLLQPPTGQWFTEMKRWWPALLIAALAFLIRFPDFGNPHIDYDEPFYLLVGERMLAGELPYVDIWDRKPIGLFLIYAGTLLLGGDKFVTYQLVASAFAAATSGIIFLIARRWVADWAAIGAAVLYLINLRLFSVGGGQSEVFYNLLMVASAWLALDVLGSSDHKRVFRHAWIAMLLCGAALQVKYMALPQCAFFGCYFLWRLSAFDRAWVKLLRNASLFATLGLFPTLLAALYYLSVGHLAPFLQANFHAIFVRGRLNDEILSWTYGYIWDATLPLLLAGIVGLIVGGRVGRPNASDATFLLAWLAAATIGLVMLGNVYIYYFAPLLVPLVLLVSPMLQRGWLGVTVFALLFFLPALWSGFPGSTKATQRREAIERMTRVVRPHIQNSFVYVYDGPTALYLTTGSRPPTRFVYPDHLNNAMEQGAVGGDTVKEVRTILAARPGAIAFGDRPIVPRWNAETERLVREALRRDYVQVDSVRLEFRRIDIFVRRPNPPAKQLCATGFDPAAAKRRRLPASTILCVPKG